MRVYQDLQGLVAMWKGGRGHPPQVLPMGVFRALLPSHPVLRATVPVETLGRRSTQTSRFEPGQPLVSEVWTPERRKTVLEYLENCGHHHNLYAFRFVVCETLNFINVVGQIFFLDVFLAGEFIRYGPKVLSHVPDGHDIDPMARVFPKLAKCTFNYFGPSGTPQVLDSLCMLPLNVVNEKVFVFLWFWLVLLSFLSFTALAYRLAVFVSPSLRSRLLLAQVRFMPRTTVGLVVHAASPADWFFLRQLGKNLNPEVFKDILEHLASRFADKGSVA